MKRDIGLADFTNKFAIRLKELRTEADLKQEELGEKDWCPANDDLPLGDKIAPLM